MRYFELLENKNVEQQKKDLIDMIKSSKSVDFIKKLGQKILSSISIPNQTNKTQINKDQIDKNKDTNTDLPLTEDMASVKAKLIKMIEKISDPIELDTIYSLAMKDVVLDKCREYYISKLGSTGKGQDRWFANLILNTKSTFEEKEEFLEHLIQHNGLFDGNALLGKKTGSFDSLIQTKNTVYQQIKTELLKHRGQLGFGPDQGPMEMFLVLFGSGISLASKGDLDVNGKIVELKASQKSKGGGVVGGRPVATSGYGTPAGVKKYFYDKLAELGASEEFLEERSFNLNPKGFVNINKVLADNGVKPAQTKELIDVIFTGLYPNMDSSLISKIYASINSDGTIDPAKFFKLHSVVQITYYKDIEGFDYLLIANSDSTNYVLISDEKDAESLYGTYKPSALISWNESRGGSAATQLIVY